MIFDTHCHVHFHAYKNDMDEVIRRTLAKGVRMITVGTQSTTSQRGLEVAERYEGVWATIGLHPNHTCEQEFQDEDELGPVGGAVEDFHTIKTRSETFDLAYYRSLVAHPKCIAIGECGLDYYRIPENLNRDEVIQKQKEQVRLQFDLASETGKPVVIHARESQADQIAMIDEYLAQGKLGKRGVAHCFTGSLVEAQQYLDRGFLVSFTGILTFPPRKGEGELSALQQVARELPLASVMVETDAPYLAPVPYRGKRNEPWMVEAVARKLAHLKGITFDEVVRKTTENAQRLFGI